jgi:hypothetical protein
VRLTALVKTASEYPDWRKIPRAEMEEMRETLAEHRMLKLKGSKSTVAGHLNDVKSTTDRIEDEVSV